MRQAWETVVAFKLVWIRVSCYFIIPFVIMFLSQTETWSGETWDNTHPFLKWRLFVTCCIAGLNALIAFIDQSMSRAKDEVKQRRAAESAPTV
jgi:hypothetical protein